MSSGLAPGMNIDFTFELIMGHSVGSHVICEYLKAGCANVEGETFIEQVIFTN